MVSSGQVLERVMLKLMCGDRLLRLLSLAWLEFLVNKSVTMIGSCFLVLVVMNPFLEIAM